ncbi:reverse transcriptase domain-containing protein [Tanacetum coccineum]
MRNKHIPWLQQKKLQRAVLMTTGRLQITSIYCKAALYEGPEVKRIPYGKSLLLCLAHARKRVEKILPSTHGRCNNKSTDKATVVKFGNIWKDAEVEVRKSLRTNSWQTRELTKTEPWTLFTDGSSCVDGSGAGLILTNPEGAEFTYAMRFRFEATNNEAEYEALIAGLRIAEQMGIKNLQANVDSRLVANQVNGSYIAKESGMVQYLNKVKTLAKSFKEFSIKQIPRSENKKADALSKIASTSFAHLNKQVLVEELKEKSINEKEILDIVEEESNTCSDNPFVKYLQKKSFPMRKKEGQSGTAESSPDRSKAVCHITDKPTDEFRYGTTLSADLAYQGKSYQTMESSFVIIHSKIGARNCASVNASLP